MKKIPREILERAHAAAATPRKTLHKHTPAISEATKELRAAIRHNRDQHEAWNKLRVILDKAAAACEWSAIDDFAALWKSMAVSSTVFSLTLGKGDEQKLVSSRISNPPQRRITLVLIEAINSLQFGIESLNRAPSRQEILKEMERHGCALDDTELSRQLGRLGWQEMI